MDEGRRALDWVCIRQTTVGRMWVGRLDPLGDCRLFECGRCPIERGASTAGEDEVTFELLSGSARRGSRRHFLFTTTNPPSSASDHSLSVFCLDELGHPCQPMWGYLKVSLPPSKGFQPQLREQEK